MTKQRLNNLMDDLLFVGVILMAILFFAFCIWGAYAINQIAENAFTTI